MKEFKYTLSDDTWGREEIEAAMRVLISRNYTMGKEVQKFELEFAKWLGSKYVIMVNSGSSANLLAIAALMYLKKLQRGDEIIVPAVSWSTTYFPLEQYGLHVKFVDIDGDTLNIDPEIIEKAITGRTRAIFVVNLLGNPCDYNKLNKICEKYNLILLEDNCEALGAKYNDKLTGTFGLIGTFSTFYSHHICTMEGGMCATDDEELYEYMLSLRAHGWTRNLPKKGKVYQKNTNPFYEKFNFIMPGFNLRPLEIEAAIGLEQIKKINSFIANRRKNAEVFVEEINKIDYLRTQKEIGRSSWFGFPIILNQNAKITRGELVKLLESKGIETRPIVAGNFTKNPAIEYFDYEIFGELNNSDNIHENGLFIGNHSNIGINEIIDVFSYLDKFNY